MRYFDLQRLSAAASLRSMRGSLGIIIVSVATVSVILAADWKVVRLHNRDYVTFANLGAFYQFPEYIRVSNAVSLRGQHRGIRAQGGTSELYINGVRFFTSFSILSNGNEELISAMDVGKIVEPVLRPSRLSTGEKVETVVLDPGHGGMDHGASNHWGVEKSFTLDVAQQARAHLQRAGYQVELTRTSDTAVSLEDRVKFANRFQNALFVSIHFNSGSGGTGLESYALAPDGVPSNASSGENHSTTTDTQWCPGNKYDGNNIALTAALHATALTRLSMLDRGVRHARFHVLRNINIPGVLIEAGFLSHPAEGQRIATAQFRQQLGGAIAQGVQNYDGAVNYRATAQTFAAARTNLPAHQLSITEPLSDAMPRPRDLRHEPSVSISGGK